MHWLLTLLLACLILSALRFAAAALAFALLLLIVWGALCRPRETIGLLAFMLLSNILMTHTAASLAVITVLGLVIILRLPSSPNSGKSGKDDTVEH